MKIFSLSVLFLAFSLLSQGCKKCSHCVEKDPAGVVQYDYGEFCGKKDEIKSYERQVKALVDPGNVIECTD